LRGKPAAGPAPKPIIGGVEAGIAQGMFDIASLLQQDRAGSELALLYVRLALMLQPEFPLAQMLLAEITEAMGNQAAAIDAYSALAASPGYSWLARLRIAGLRDSAGDTAAALADLSKMGAEHPTRFDALWRKADILRTRERFMEATEAYDAAIARVATPDRRHWSLFFGRGIALERAKRWDRAESDMKKALALQPEQPYVLNYLGYTWLEQNTNLTEAKAMIERAVALRPQDGAIVDSLGWAYYRLGDFETAAKHLERAVELKANDATINDHLGDAYWRVGRKLEARFQWIRAMSLEPDADLKAALEKKLADPKDPPIATTAGKAP
jgi:Flp pilus assembly protein TadD